jgi:hypothetical protein
VSKVADFVVIRNALAAQVTAVTGLRCDGQARDQVSPPCSVVLPGQPFITYGVTTDGALNFNLAVLIIVSDAAPAEKTQRALDVWLGIGEDTSETESVPAAVMSDITLGGVVHFIEPVSIGTYGRITYANVVYFGAQLNLTGGAI